ncbi:hypothetical protein AVW09_09725 [Microbacterium sp. T32]|nr:hypothetical protein AVW09_09725 [Microbacterium sp. T32]
MACILSDDYKKFFAGFSRRRALFWYFCLGVSSVLLTFYYLAGNYYWIWILSVPLIMILANGELIRFMRSKAAKRAGGLEGRD